MVPFTVIAAEVNSTSSATITPTVNQKVEDLKDRLATKVAQLNQSERRAIYGTVKTTTISTITVETATKNIKIELTDDIKVFQVVKGKRTELKIEDVVKNDVVSIFGNWDTAVEVLKAKVIFIHDTTNALLRISGTVTEVKKSDYTITLKTNDEKIYTIDFETTTKTNVWTKDKEIEKGGFSKLVSGDTLYVVGTEVPKKENRISASRILNIGTLTGTKPTGTPMSESKESTGSATRTNETPAKSPSPAENP